MEFTIKHVIEFSPEAAEILKSLFAKQEITTAGPKTKKAAALTVVPPGATTDPLISGFIKVAPEMLEDFSVQQQIEEAAQMQKDEVVKHTLEQVRAAAAAKKDSGLPGTKIKELLSTYGVEKLPDLPESNYTDFLTKLAALK